MFLKGTPKSLEPYKKAHDLKMEWQDVQAWHQGLYILSATTVAVDRNLHGKDARSKYIEEPLSVTQKREEKFNNLTESDIKHYQQVLIDQLKGMQQAFEATHNKV